MQLLTATTTAELERLVKEHQADASKTVILLFTGTKRPEDGKSWCPDCVVAEPVIEGVVEQLKKVDSLVFITVPVGDLPTWKSPDNQFRKHADYAVGCVPTLVNLKKAQRLEEGACADAVLVKGLFEGSDAIESGSTTVKGGTCEGGVCRISLKDVFIPK